MVVKYVYDAWGNHKVLNADGTEITSSTLYYLQTRYYDPVTGRFLNRDSVKYADPSTVHGLNLYAYCRNNPVMYIDPTGGFPILAVILGITALAGFGLTIGGVASDNGMMTAAGLTMAALPALISGGIAVAGGIGGATLTGAIGGATLISGFGTALFASAEYQQAVTGNNWMLDAGMSEGWYNGLMFTAASLATMGTFASNITSFLKVKSVLEVGKITGVRAGKGYYGIRFKDVNGLIRSLEIHPAHNGHGLHLQLNNWWLNKAGYIGKYYRAFSKHFDFLKFWRGWF